MKRIFLDTNFVIDYLLREDYKSSSQLFLAQCAHRKIGFYISFLTVANFAYIARKLPHPELKKQIAYLCDLFNVVPNDDIQIKKVLALNVPDFEDGLQYQSAIDSGCECIITRNEKHFMFSSIPVMSAQAFINRFFIE